MRKPHRAAAPQFRELVKAFRTIELNRIDGRSTRRQLAEMFNTTETAIAKRIQSARASGLLPKVKPGSRGTKVVVSRILVNEDEIEELANNCWADLDTDCNGAPGSLDRDAVMVRLTQFANEILKRSKPMTGGR